MQSGGRGREGGGGGGLERERKKEVDKEGLEKEELEEYYIGHVMTEK